MCSRKAAVMHSSWGRALVLFAFLFYPLPGHAGDSVEVVGAQFGVFDQSGTSVVSFTPSTTVPLVTGQAYGWIIRLRTDLPVVHWKEEFTLPKAPARWGTPHEDSQSSISPDRKVSVLERDASTKDGGIVFNAWSVADGDPEGKYKIRVIINGNIERVFEFYVVAPGSV